MRLLHDPALAARLASNAHEETQRYCWKAVRTQWLQFYKSVATPALSEQGELGSQPTGLAIRKGLSLGPSSLEKLGSDSRRVPAE